MAMATRPELQPTAARLLELNGSRVLVPIIRGQEATPVLSLGLAIASHASTQGVLLGLVEIPASDAGLQMAVAKRSRELLSWIAAADHRCDRPRLSNLHPTARDRDCRPRRVHAAATR